MKEKIRKHREALRQEVEAAGQELLNKDMPVLTEELFSLYEKNGNRLIYEAEYFERRRFLVTFGLLSIWYHKPEHLNKLEMIIRDICSEETWALPAHVDRSQPDWRRTVDLFACETGQTLAEITSILKEDISEQSRELVKTQVLERLIDSYMAVPRGEWRWEKFRNNWVAVCAGSLGSIAIYLLDDRPEKQKACLDRVLDTLPEYLDSMEEDGTCPEGLSYFTYGMTYYTGFARQLCEHTNGETDIMKWPKLEQIARFQSKCYFPGGKTVSFSDGSREDKYRLGLTCFLAKEFPGAEIPDTASAMHYKDDGCYRWMSNYRDYIWTEEYLKYAEDMPDKPKEEWLTVLPAAQWAIGKSENGVGFAVKGGHNDEPHNHNDVGSFLYCAGGEFFLSDLGCGEYTRDYFGSGRYEILCNRSLGHNVPLINGKEQKTGIQYRAEGFACTEKGQVSLSIGGAYEKGLVEELTRKLCFQKEDGRLTVQDICRAGAEACQVKENLVTQIEPVVEGSRVILNGANGTAYIDISMDQLTINIVETAFMNHSGIPERVWLIQWEMPSEGGKAECCFTITYTEGKGGV